MLTIQPLLEASFSNIIRNGMRSILTALGVIIGVGAVIIMVAIGRGSEKRIHDEISALGTNLIIVLPGRAETSGAAAGVLSGETTRDLTLADAGAVSRLRGVVRVAPLNIGVAQVSRGGLSREAVLVGTTADMLEVRHMHLAEGHYLPTGPRDQTSPVCVLG